MVSPLLEKFTLPNGVSSRKTLWLSEMLQLTLKISRPASSADHSSLHHRTLLEPVAAHWHIALASRQHAFIDFNIYTIVFELVVSYEAGHEAVRESLLRRHKDSYTMDFVERMMGQSSAQRFNSNSLLKFTPLCVPICSFVCSSKSLTHYPEHPIRSLLLCPVPPL